MVAGSLKKKESKDNNAQGALTYKDNVIQPYMNSNNKKRDLHRHDHFVAGELH